MKIKSITVFLFVGALCMLLVVSCKKDKEEDFVNPYNDPTLAAPVQSSNLADIDPSNFVYLQNKIFNPFCANSGCHDGTFPPDYRTISSTYNTLVYQKPVNTDNGKFRYRVFPFNADSSIIYHRMTVPMGSGIMPIDYSVSEDWTSKADEYILAVKTWINAGAKDMFGNIPTAGNLQPTITGLVAFPAGTSSNAYTRGGGIAPIDVPANSSIDLWFLIGDDVTPVASIDNDTCKLSGSISSFATASTSLISYTASGITADDFSGSNTQFYHKTTISTNGYLPGTYLYLRTSIDDGSQGVSTVIPNDGSSDIMKGYFALKIQ